jgi:hypothetical protein
MPQLRVEAFIENDDSERDENDRLIAGEALWHILGVRLTRVSQTVPGCAV